MAIKCYVKAITKSEAEQAAWDLSYTVDHPEDAEEFPAMDARPGSTYRLYEVTIAAKRKAKP